MAETESTTLTIRAHSAVAVKESLRAAVQQQRRS